MSVSQTVGRHNKLLMGTALVGAFVAAYGRRAYAGNCAGVGGIFTCSGPAGADTTQTLSGTPLAVTTTAGFGITTAVGDAFSLTGTNGITFTDTNNATITGATNGITAFNQGSGALSITTTGLVTGAGTAPQNGGIYAYNTGTDLTIHAAGVSGGYDGIRAYNNGSGALSITTTGLVTVAGTAPLNGGILAFNTSSGTDLTIHAADVRGGADGIIALNFGSGALSITTTGLVTGTGTDTSNAGIVAYNAGTNLTIAATDVSGTHQGIFAYNNGSGILSITTTGAVTGTNADGIYASNSGTDLTIQAADVSGSYRGIDVRNLGGGALSITATGAVTAATTGTNTTGIYAYNGINGTDLTIHAANVSGGADGISGVNFGSGALSITTTGLVTGTGTATYNGGIVTFNATSGTDLTINAADVSGGSYGIYAQNSGGALSITTTGLVKSTGTATYNGGIVVYNTIYGTNLTIAAADVSGANYGIFATNFGFGALSITATGTVTGTGRYGIVAQDYLGVTDLTITAADVSGGDDGIRAYHRGSGILSITTTGAVTGSGRYGIFTTNAEGTRTFVTVSATGSVAGADAGINAVSNAGQPIEITNAGTISNLAATPTSLAISTIGGPTTITNNGLVLGTVALGNFDDSFSNAATGTWNTAGGSNDFGAGIDAVDNDGTVVAAANPGAAETTTFANLETFRNNASGILTLQDGDTGDAVVFSGNYLGNGGRLLLDTLLAGDGSPSDRLVIDGGSATGLTSMIITNVGGAGALTTGNGILVVDDTMGQTTTPGAFSLGGPVGAGLFEYQLFRGGVTAGAENDWFLRSTAPPPRPTPPGLPQPSPGPVPLIRPEIPGYLIVPGMASELGRASIGTFHERQGDQMLLTGDGPVPAGWGRLFGSAREQQWSPTINGIDFQIGPEIDGHLWGLQTGLDLFGFEHANGSQDRVGLFFSHAEATGDITGFTLGRVDNPSGELDLEGNSLGAYWTHVGSSGGYVDVVAMQTWLDGDATSNRGIGADLGGSAFAASLESGYPFALGGGWTLEPQIQGIWQYIDPDDTSDPFTSINYDAFDAFSGRVGVRLESDMQVGTTPLQPFLDVNLWHNFSATDTIIFNTRSVALESEGTTLEVGGGLSAKLTPMLGAYAQASYGIGLDDEDDAETFSGNIGLRIQW